MINIIEAETLRKTQRDREKRYKKTAYRRNIKNKNSTKTNFV